MIHVTAEDCDAIRFRLRRSDAALTLNAALALIQSVTLYEREQRDARAMAACEVAAERMHRASARRLTPALRTAMYGDDIRAEIEAINGEPLL